jgi:hypothetical protein
VDKDGGGAASASSPLPVDSLPSIVQSMSGQDNGNLKTKNYLKCFLLILNVILYVLKKENLFSFIFIQFFILQFDGC